MIESADLDYWAERYQKYGAAEMMRVAHALWQHMKSVRPDWPTEEDRAEDLAHYIHFKALLERSNLGLVRLEKSSG